MVPIGSGARRPHRRALWLVWPPHELRRRQQFLRMWLYGPLPVFVSRYQVSVYGRFLPKPDPPLVLPFGLPDAVRGRPPLGMPPLPRAVFASNPMRDLTWLLGIWERRILPRVPGAELHIYGLRDYEHRYADRRHAGTCARRHNGVHRFGRRSLRPARRGTAHG